MPCPSLTSCGRLRPWWSTCLETHASPKEKLYSTLKIAHEMIALRSRRARHGRNVVRRDLSGATRPISTSEPPPGQLGRTGGGLATESGGHQRGVLSQVQEAVEAPCCLLAIVDPGIKTT